MPSPPAAEDGPAANLTAARFRPGSSGNPGGRPKSLTRHRARCRKAVPVVIAAILRDVARKTVPLCEKVEAFEVLCAQGGYLPADRQALLGTGHARVLLLALAIKSLNDKQRDQLVAALAETTPAGQP